MVAGWPKWLKDYNNTQGGSCWAGAPGPPIPLINWPRMLECTRATCSHELGSSITGSTSSSVQPQRYSVSIPSSSLSPVKPPSFRENAGVQATRSDEPFSSTTGSTCFVAQPQRYSVSTPPSISPVKSSSFRDSAGLQETHSHKLGSSATGSTSSGMQLGRH